VHRCMLSSEFAVMLCLSYDLLGAVYMTSRGGPDAAPAPPHQQPTQQQQQQQQQQQPKDAAAFVAQQGGGEKKSKEEKKRPALTMNIPNYDDVFVTPKVPYKVRMMFLLRRGDILSFRHPSCRTLMMRACCSSICCRRC
jgi:hypothetical protein